MTKNCIRKFGSIIAMVVLVVGQIMPLHVHAQTVLNLPQPGAMVSRSVTFNPTIIKGITIHPDDPFMFDFIVHPGDLNLQDENLKEESQKLIKYFMAALTVPEEEMWVNLSPYEKDRIISKGFGDTEMGRDLLAQDYMLKQLTASLMYPEKELGREFWNRIYEKAQSKYGVSEIPMNTFNKVWIVPEKAVIYESGTSAFIVESHLKVMLEEDYLALEANEGSNEHGLGDVTKNDLTQISEVSSEVLRNIIIPEIEREVNEGKTFANLRQISNSVILATWYKKNIQGSILEQIYINKNKTKGIDTEDKEINQKIYNQYVEAFKKGVYEFIKEDYDETIQEVVPRKYFSGGVKKDWRDKIDRTRDRAQLSIDLDGAHIFRAAMRTSNNDGAMLSAREWAKHFQEYPLKGKGEIDSIYPYLAWQVRDKGVVIVNALGELMRSRVKGWYQAYLVARRIGDDISLPAESQEQAKVIVTEMFEKLRFEFENDTDDGKEILQQMIRQDGDLNAVDTLVNIALSESEKRIAAIELLLDNQEDAKTDEAKNRIAGHVPEFIPALKEGLAEGASRAYVAFLKFPRKENLQVLAAVREVAQGTSKGKYDAIQLLNFWSRFWDEERAEIKKVLDVEVEAIKVAVGEDNKDARGALVQLFAEGNIKAREALTDLIKTVSKEVRVAIITSLSYKIKNVIKKIGLEFFEDFIPYTAKDLEEGEVEQFFYELASKGSIKAFEEMKRVVEGDFEGRYVVAVQISLLAEFESVDDAVKERAKGLEERVYQVSKEGFEQENRRSFYFLRAGGERGNERALAAIYEVAQGRSKSKGRAIFHLVNWGKAMKAMKPGKERNKFVAIEKRYDQLLEDGIADLDVGLKRGDIGVDAMVQLVGVGYEPAEAVLKSVIEGQYVYDKKLGKIRALNKMIKLARSRKSIDILRWALPKMAEYYGLDGLSIVGDSYEEILRKMITDESLPALFRLYVYGLTDGQNLKGEVTKLAYQVLQEDKNTSIATLLGSDQFELNEIVKSYYVAVALVLADGLVQDDKYYIDDEQLGELVSGIMGNTQLWEQYQGVANSGYVIGRTNMLDYVSNGGGLFTVMAHELGHNISVFYREDLNYLNSTVGQRGAVSELLADFTNYAFLEIVDWEDEIKEERRRHGEKHHFEIFGEEEKSQGMAEEEHQASRAAIEEIHRFYDQKVEFDGKTPFTFKQITMFSLDYIGVVSNGTKAFEGLLEELRRKYQGEETSLDFSESYSYSRRKVKIKSWTNGDERTSGVQENDALKDGKGDGAMVGNTKGGIDLNPKISEMRIRGEGARIQFPVSLQGLELEPVEGFVPVIINVNPVTNIPLLLGESTEASEQKLSSRNVSHSLFTVTR